MKKTAIFLCLILFISLLAACGSNPAPESTTEAVTTLPVTEIPVTTTEAPTTEAPTTEAPTEPEPTEDPAIRDRELFYHNFWELDPEETDAWLEQHPEYLENGYMGISINQAWLTDRGLDLKTTQGHQVLAIDAVNGILIVRIWPSGSKGVLAICRNPEQLHLCASKDIGTAGEQIGDICERNDGLLAITACGFDDPKGTGNGGLAYGACRCRDGVEYGYPMGWDYFRLTLTDSGWFRIGHADGPFDADCRYAMEFEPALLIDGELQPTGMWYENNPRACVGQNRRGEILMMGVEGRRSDSPGCPVRVCAEIMLEYEGYTAMNMDGGTTAILWYRGQPIMRTSNLGAPEGRRLPNAWVYVKADED